MSSFQPPIILPLHGSKSGSSDSLVLWTALKQNIRINLDSLNACGMSYHFHNYVRIMILFLGSGEGLLGKLIKI